MLNQAESQIAGLKKELKSEKKLREEEESLSSDLQRSLLACTDTLEQTKTSFKEEKMVLLRRAEEAELKLEPVT
jgi:hypothetical protein